MKKNLFIFIFSCIIATYTLQAQEMFAKNVSLVNVGIGVFPGIGACASYDYGLIDTWGPGIFTVGGYIGFSRRDGYSKDGSNQIDLWDSESLIAGRATYRYSINNQFEAYGAFMLGISVSKWKSRYTDYGLSSGLTAGCRYLLTKDIALFAEMGYNVLCLNGGISISF